MGPDRPVRNTRIAAQILETCAPAASPASSPISRSARSSRWPPTSGQFTIHRRLPAGWNTARSMFRAGGQKSSLTASQIAPERSSQVSAERRGRLWCPFLHRSSEPLLRCASMIGAVPCAAFLALDAAGFRTQIIRSSARTQVAKSSCRNDCFRSSCPVQQTAASGHSRRTQTVMVRSARYHARRYSTILLLCSSRLLRQKLRMARGLTPQSGVPTHAICRGTRRCLPDHCSRLDSR